MGRQHRRRDRFDLNTGRLTGPSPSSESADFAQRIPDVSGLLADDILNAVTVAKSRRAVANKEKTK